MPLRPLSDMTPASWFVEADADPWARIILGPPGFEAYVRVLYRLDDDAPDHADLLTRDQAREILVRHTSTPDDCYFGVWRGNGMDNEWEHRHADLPRFHVPDRDYFLFGGGLGDADHWDPDGPDLSGIPAHLEWPADHAWFVASDVDPDWFAVGGTQLLIDELLADARLDVLATTYGPRQPEYR